MNMNMMIGENI